MRSRARSLLSAVVVAAGLAAPAAQAAVTILPVGSGGLVSELTAIIDAGESVISQKTAIPGVPSAPSVNANAVLYDSTVSGNLSDAGFAFTLDQFNIGQGVATIGRGDVAFKVDVDTSFSFAGSFTTEEIISAAVPLEGEPGINPDSTAIVMARLVNVTTNTVVFEDFRLGGIGQTLTLNNAAGVLKAGDEYQFQFEGLIGALTDPTGDGTITLALAPVTPDGGGGPTPAPLPAAVWVGLAMGGAVLARKRVARA